jgi:hypothetical protein
MSWLSRNAHSIEAVAAIITALTAVLAVIGVIAQLRATDTTSRAQSAREAYAAHLVLATANPDFAAPTDACALIASPKGAAYDAYVDHLLYAAEQMLSVEAGWDDTFIAALSPHAATLCSAAPDQTPEMAAVMAEFRVQMCDAAPICTADAP